MNLVFDDIQAARRSRRTDPGTSHAAAKNADRFAASHAGRILEALAQGPRTAAGLAAMTGLTVEQVCRRLPEMQSLNLAAPMLAEDSTEVAVNGYRVWRAV